MLCHVVLFVTACRSVTAVRPVSGQSIVKEESVSSVLVDFVGVRAARP
ncbi:hypothetical protein [Streptomyces sp. NPDC051132]